MFIRKKKKTKEINNLRPIHLALVNDNIITTESVQLALSRMNEEKIGIHIERIEVIPFLRKLMLYINQYKLDLVIMDGDLEKQDVSLYIQRIKNFDKDIKIIVLAKVITPQLEALYNKKFIDQYITLPFQDANLWGAITKIFSDDIDIDITSEILLKDKGYSHKEIENLKETFIETTSDDINILNDDILFSENNIDIQNENDLLSSQNEEVPIIDEIKQYTNNEKTIINTEKQYISNDDEEIFNIDDDIDNDSNDIFDLTGSDNTPTPALPLDRKMNVFEYSKQKRAKKMMGSNINNKSFD